jgi:hypothetical protein
MTIYIQRCVLVFILLVLPALAQNNITFTELPQATIGAPYKTALNLQAAAPFHLDLASNSQVPKGLKLEQDGAIDGTPAAGTTGSYLFEVVVTDGNQVRQTGVFRLLVSAAAGSTAAGANSCSSGKFSASVSTLDFGKQEVGSQSDDKEITITNDAENDNTSVCRPAITCADPARCGSHPDFLVTDNSCGTKIVKGGTCHIKISFAPHQAGDAGSQSLVFNNLTLALTGTGQNWKSPFTRLVAGLDIAAASSADTQQQFMVEANLTAPLRLGPAPNVPEGHKEDPLDRRLWVFANPKITSAPQSASDISGLNLNADFFSPILSGKTTDIVQAFDLKFGGEIFLIKPREGARFWGEYADTDAKFSLAFVAMGGFLTPFSTANRTTQVFTINDSIKAQFPNIPSGKTNIAFVTQDRTRFLRSYYGGLRFKTYFFSTINKDENGNPALYNLFPGTIDMTVGQDESVTGGSLHGSVFRVEGVYPLPYFPALHIFAGAHLALSANTNSVPLNLQLTSPPVAVNDNSVFLQTVSQPNRDRYHIGLGIDLIQLFNRKSPSKPGNGK